MSKHRFTIKELEEMSDKLIVLIILNERLNELTNPYSPLSERLGKIISKFGKLEEAVLR